MMALAAYWENPTKGNIFIETSRLSCQKELKEKSIQYVWNRPVAGKRTPALPTSYPLGQGCSSGLI